VELTPGYKRSDIGIIPDDWDISKLGEHASFRTGPFGSSLHKSDYTVDGVPVINPMHLNEGKIEPTATMTITEQAARKLSEFRVSPGEILIGRRGEMGRCAVVNEQQAGWLCGTGSMIVRARNFDPEFLQLVLSSPKAVGAIEEASVGTTMINLNQGTLARLRVQRPKPSEQRAIAAAVRDTTALLDGLTRLIAKKRDLKQAAMQQLLTGHARLPGFGQPWGASAVGNEFDIQLGKMLDAGKNAGVAKPYIGNSAVQWGRIDTSDLPIVRMSPRDIERYRLRKGDLLVCEGGDVGRAAIWEAPMDECYYQKALHRLRPRADYDVRFMAALLELWSMNGVFSGYVTQTSIAHLPQDRFARLPLPVPSATEQRNIADVLCDMDSEMSALEALLDKTRALKQGMMQELLTGRTRLV
jgi:type I restriction enzyme, S subunit